MEDDKQALVWRVTVASQLMTVVVFAGIVSIFLFCCGGWEDFIEPWLQDITHDEAAIIEGKAPMPRKQDTSGLLAQFIAGREKNTPSPPASPGEAKKKKKKKQ